MTINRSAARILYVARRHNSYISTPIFYANAAPHLGHLYTAVLADAAHRWEVVKNPAGKHIFSTGTDEHGIKILRAAEAAKKEPQTFCDDISSVFAKLFNNLDIQYTDYIRTTQPHHRKAVQHMWKVLKDEGLIYNSIYKGWYSMVDECFYPEKDVENSHVAASNVKVVKGTQTVVEWIEEENYMFKLSKFRGEIKNWLSNNDIIHPKHYLPIVLKYLEGDEDLSISRCRKRLPWGIPVPDDPDQTIYVWLDALVNYLSICGYPADSNAMKSNWPPTTQILGKDIMKFHAIYWPAFLLGAGLPLPKRLFIHGHWLVNNIKMSKSIGNVVDPFQAAKEFTTEGLRYFLLKQGVPHDDSNFTPKKALQVINSDLVNNIGNLLSRSTVAKLNPEQQYPRLNSETLKGSPLVIANPLIESLNEIRDSTIAHFDQMHFYKAIESLMSVLKQGNAFFQAAEPWKMAYGEDLSTVLHICYETIRISAILMQPIVPQFSSHALDRLGTPADQRCLENAKFGRQPDLRSPLGVDKGPFLRRLK